MGWVVRVTPRPRFSPGERTPRTHCTGGWVGPRAGLDTEVRGKILSLLPGIEPRSSGRPARSQTLHWLSYRLTSITVSPLKYLASGVLVILKINKTVQSSQAHISTYVVPFFNTRGPVLQTSLYAFRENSFRTNGKPHMHRFLQLMDDGKTTVPWRRLSDRNKC
jgi:hypothetical protein